VLSSVRGRTGLFTEKDGGGGKEKWGSREGKTQSTQGMEIRKEGPKRRKHGASVWLKRNNKKN